MTLKTLLAAALAASTALAQGLNYPAGLQPGDEYRVLFVTDSTRDATSTDISVYDAFVTADANAVPFLAALNTNWRAVGSTATVSARDHTDTVSGGVPIFRPDGVRVADDYDHLWDAVTTSLPAGPAVTASGALTTNELVWAGCWGDGTISPWPLGSAGGQAMAGIADFINHFWVLWAPHPVTSSHRLYGISDVLKMPYPDYPRDLKPGDQFRILFVTDSTRDATSSNINDYDDFVTADAQVVPALQLFQTDWRAVASTPSVSARSHTGTTGSVGVPIYRPDGTRIANGYAHLWGTILATLLAPPNITATGAVTSASRVWTGTSAQGVSLGNQLGAVTGSSFAGEPGSTGLWHYFDSGAQGANRPLYGISDVITVPEPKHPQDLQPGQRYRVLFLTDGTRDATSANITDYDDFVSADADAVPAMRLYDTEWKAVASTPSVSAKVHTGTDPSVAGVPIYRPDGTHVANDYASLWFGGLGALLAPPNVTASGAVRSAPAYVWTGTDFHGNATFDPLGDANGYAWEGDAGSITVGWIWANSNHQSHLRPLYGISEVLFVQGKSV
ncbi:MAG: hypothetical protein KDC98_26065, partial [Planctomycetes bacterium]|nr:hypothetical protein [Planctomycetota bacterium]